MEIAIYILLIVMAEMRENIGMKNHHPLHKTNVSIRNEGKGVQGKDFSFSASIVFCSYITHSNIDICSKYQFQFYRSCKNRWG